jgi:iron complex outermembrane receptor protein
MKANPKLSYAIAVSLGASAAGLVYAAPAPDADVAADQLQEVTVTAQRRAEKMQDVPITIQALTSETLTQLNVATFDEILRYLPNVTNASFGPGITHQSII